MPVLDGLLTKRDSSYPKFEKYPGGEICRRIGGADSTSPDA